MFKWAKANHILTQISLQVTIIYYTYIKGLETMIAIIRTQMVIMHTHHFRI